MQAHQPRILIVDDVPDNIDLLCKRFVRRGFEVAQAPNGPEALERIAAESFDLVLLDVIMPGMDGYQVLETIRREHSASSLPVVMVTAKAENSDVIKALELGANDYVTKPVDFAIAFARVQALIARKHAEDELRRAHLDLHSHVEQLEKAIDERDKWEARAEHLIRHDALTSLGNRSLLRERLSKATKRVAAEGGGFALICLDVNQFKGINDAFGHGAGDELLQVLARRIEDCVSDRDTVARLAADQFAVIASEAETGEDAGAIARALQAAVAEPCEVDGRSLILTCSVGIALCPGDGADPEGLLRNAEMALKRARAEGRGVCRFAQPDIDARARARRILEMDLHDAFDNGELEIRYQPILDLETAKVSGAEALLRWTHPQKGSIPPSEFIPLAEETGQISRLGRWVLEEACAVAAGWPAGLGLAVNLSAVQLDDTRLTDTVDDALSASGLPAERLELEITETALFRNFEQTSEILHQLRRRGIRISMDDFGTGHSSLSYIRKFPFDRIKIDKSFVSDMSASKQSIAIVKGVIALARNFEARTTGEGVETGTHLARLKAEGCSEAQGFYISKPLEKDEFLAFLASFDGQAKMRQAEAAAATSSLGPRAA